MSVSYSGVLSIILIEESVSRLKAITIVEFTAQIISKVASHGGCISGS